MARGFEFAVVPVIFGGAGYGLDRWLGIVPVFTIVFALWALIVVSVRMGSRYAAEMKAQEATGPWARPRPGAGATPPMTPPGTPPLTPPGTKAL